MWNWCGRAEGGNEEESGLRGSDVGEDRELNVLKEILRTEQGPMAT